jgi:hypothetical protein
VLWVVFVDSSFCPDGLQMGSGIVFVGSPFCPDGLQRCVEFLLLEERLVLVA